MSLGSGIAWVTAGNAAGQVLQLVALPLLAKSATPAAFGLYTVFLGAGAVASVVAGLKYDSAIVLPRRQEEARLLVVIVMVLAVAATVLSIIGTCIAAFVVSDRALARLIWPLGLALCCNVFLNAVHRVANAWLGREFRFALVGLNQFTLGGATAAAQLGLLSLGIEPTVALAYGSVLGQAAAVLVVSVEMSRVYGDILRTRVLWSEISKTARRYQAFPKYMIAYGLNSTLRERLIHFVLGGFAGADLLGRFAMAQRLVGAPHMFLHAGISPVLYSHASRLERHAVAGLGARLIEMAVVALVAPYVFLAAGAPLIAHHLFGPHWAGTEEFIRVLALPFLVLSCTAFLDRLFDAYHNQRVALRLELCYSAVVLPVVIAFAGSGYAFAAVLGFAIVFLAYEIVWTHAVYRTNELHVTHLARPAIMACGYLALAALVAALILTNVRDMRLQALCAAGAYAGMAWWYLQFHSGWQAVRRLFSS